MRTDKQIVDELKKASAGLLVMSESDYPLEVIQWDGSTEINAQFLRGLTSEAKECPIQEVAVEQILADGRFERLERSLRDSLTNLKAYKVGTINIPVYIVGKSPEGSWLGLSTRLIQT